MTNRHRGEVSVELGGRRLKLRLSLQALAEIEAAFGASDMSAMGARFASGQLSARDLVVITGATVRGGGETLDDRTIASMIGADEIEDLVCGLSDLFAMSFGTSARADTPRP